MELRFTGPCRTSAIDAGINITERHSVHCSGHRIKALVIGAELRELCCAFARSFPVGAELSHFQGIQVHQAIVAGVILLSFSWGGTTAPRAVKYSAPVRISATKISLVRNKTYYLGRVRVHMGEARVRLPFVWTQARCQDNGASEAEREKRWAELFEQLDVNKDGKIDINELRSGLAAWGVVRSDPDEVSHAQTLTEDSRTS